MSHSPPLTPPPAETIAYRPLSGLALASLALSGLFAIVLLASLVVALIKGAPVFFSGWFLVLPVGGAVLGVLAQGRIRRAEGTLAGALLARWGMWLGLLGGLGYGAYYFATGLAVEQQANQFLMVEGEDTGFFPRLLKGDVNRAFLLAVPYGRRGGTNPDDERQMAIEFDRPATRELGMLTQFRTNDLVPTVVEAGREHKPVHPLGVRGWAYEGGTYRVERVYRVTTREGQVDFLVPVIADQDPAGGGRKWHVDLKGVRALPGANLTPLGQTLAEVRQSANTFVMQWVKSQTMKVHQLRPEKDGFRPSDETPWEQIPVIVAKVGKKSAAEVTSEIRVEVKSWFLGQPMNTHGVRVRPQLKCPLEQTDGHLRIALSFQMPLLVPKGANEPDYMGEGKIVVQSRQRVDLENPPVGFEWRVLSYRLDRVMPAPKERPGPG
jgi:hypothetical protein